MAYGYEAQQLNAPAHKLSLDDRGVLCVSGVTDVERFDETAVILCTTMGTLVVRGEGLHMQSLSLEGGQVTIDGSINALQYEDRAQGGFLARLLG